MIQTHPTPLRHKRQQAGFFIENMSFALIISAILIAAAIFMFINMRRNASVQENATQINYIASQARKLYGSRNVYGDVTTAIAARSIVPVELRDGAAATASNKYGAPLTFAAANGTSTNDLLNMTWANVPREECEDLVVSTSDLMRRITVGGTDVKPLDAPISTAALSTQCATGNTVSIQYSIGR